MTVKNRRIVLASRPQGAPTHENFRLEEVDVPSPGPGEMLLRTLWLSLDPYMRGRMSDAPSYTPPVEVDAVMCGGTVCRVEESNLDGFTAGDLVLAYTGWQDYAVSDSTMVQKLDRDMARPSYALGVLGMPGFTAYTGLLDIGRPQPGETVAVAAATGAVGSVVGQIAKMKGCRVIGIAGGAEKCRYATETLGFDACVDHRAKDFAKTLKDTAGEAGIDVYFENVGGKVLDAILPCLNTGARIPLCGLIANYNLTGLPEGPDRTPIFLRNVLVKRLKVQGFIIFDYQPRYPEFLKEMTPWVASGDITYREDVAEGLESAPEAFMGLLEGRNFGKLVVKVAD
ncbi:Putative oxidoreductase YncB [Caenispirillum salinarum AK4]|uniref:Putative oxidoreductase YncB n=1 Tax=Caenispirillum salinarum AK4 TaxID=1238182 RepID=K9GVK0_9PROT|nr:NADP-dependent oxidoreductase [Caenispirillum salinarum]EKV29222.1 Putative oxidoreductase YncB [Caenispirillum salinarum AK4]